MAEEKSNNQVSISKGWLAAIIVAFFVISGGAFASGVAAGRFHGGVFETHTAESPMSKHMMFSGGGVYGGVLRTNQNTVKGVVTAVNGSSFTVAGNGATNTVTTDSSTQWHGGDSVKVNDSVIASGDLSNNTFTATDIVVNP